MSDADEAMRLAPGNWDPGDGPDPLVRAHDHIGKSLSRIDGSLKVLGAARFAAEFAPERMCYATLAFSTIAKGRIATIDTSAAETAPGVVLVMTYRNAPRLQPMPMIYTAPRAAGFDDLPIMQDERISWNGQPIALVLAETQEQADLGASLVRVSYEVEEATTAFGSAKAAGTETGTFRGRPLALRVGDAEAALAVATHKVDNVYRTPRHNHNAMEPHAVTVFWREGNLCVHDSTQLVTHTAWSLAQIFGITESDVHVTSPYVGGGFGAKTLWQHHVLAAAAAKLAARPVRLTLSREGVYRVVGGRALTEQRVAIGADRDGRFTAIVHTGTTIISHHSALRVPFIGPAQICYASQTFELDVRVAYLDVLAMCTMRAPGEAVGSYALECAVDELAVAMDVDPIELRLRNEPTKDPIKDLPWSSRNVVEAYRRGAERFGWRARASPGARREGEWLIGIGCATATYPYYRLPGGAARITIDRDGRARVEVAAHEMGMGTATAQTQIAAERLALPLDRVTFAYGDSFFPGLIIAGGAQQTAAIGGAVIAAHRALVEKLLELAGERSALAGLAPDEVGAREGGLAALAEPSRHETYAEILTRAGRDHISVAAEAQTPSEFDHWSMHSWGAMFCEVHVNAVTGETRVKRFLGSFDCGRIINAKTAASQFRGGIIMGLGLALMEETQFDERKGRIMNPSLAEYHLPVHLDVPPIEVIWTDIPDPHTPMGARGIGEIGITGTGAAVANAVFNATGKRVRDLPLTLDKIL